MRMYNSRNEYVTRKELRNNMTTAEVILWSKLKGKQLKGYKFRRQYSVDGYIVDFYCPKLRMAIEIDGSSHDGKEAKEYDKERQLQIENLGISFLRFTNQDIFKNLTKVLTKISDYLPSGNFPILK